MARFFQSAVHAGINTRAVHKRATVTLYARRLYCPCSATLVIAPRVVLFLRARSILSCCDSDMHIITCNKEAKAKKKDVSIFPSKFSCTHI